MANDKDFLIHYGVGHDKGGHSGRFPWGSGDNPFQRDGFLQTIRDYKKQGFTEREIAEKMNITAKDRNGNVVPSVAKLRIQVSLAEDYNRKILVDKVEKLREEGKSLPAIAKEVGLPNESSVRSLLNKESKARMEATLNTANILKDAVDEKGIVYVGKGVAQELGVTEDRLKTALYVMQLNGYEVYGGGIPQVTNSGKQINGQYLCVPGTEHKDIYDYDKVKTIREYESRDGGETFEPKYARPTAISRDRVFVRYPDEGGADLDGTIEIRKGVKDLDLRGSNYAQVRVLMDNGCYLKGMAIYGKDSDFPPGTDVIFNTSKARGTPEEKVFKKAKTEDPDNPFGALIKPGIFDPDDPSSYKKVGQGYYYDENGNKKLSPINKTREEGDWDEWKKTVPSQFLAKQSKSLCQKQLDLSKAEAMEQYEEIMAISNPTIKKKMLVDFADNCDKAAKTLAAAALPGQRYQVILPVPSLKDNEIYAPNWSDGDTVALVRYPHGGTFEIPILKVNNKSADGRETIGPHALDAVGINPKVAARLSGADYDGDTVMVIPCNSPKSKVRIVSTPPLKGLEGFDNKMEYAGYEGMKVLSKDRTQIEMGKVSNLITDMTIKGASPDEIARAVRHSMVVIDANKHKLDYKKSYTDNGIEELKKLYMEHITEDGKISYGASTILSRANAEKNITKRQGTPRIDPETGKLIYKEADNPYYMKKITNKDGTITYKKTLRTQKSTQMDETDDAYKLVSDVNNQIERVYADYANYMKNMANNARLQSLEKNAGKQVYSPAAKKVYEEEVESINSKLRIAEMNAPREARAQMIANARIKERKKKYSDNGEEIPKKELKKMKQIELEKARAQVGADGKGTKIRLSDKEWNAIQAGAITETKLWNVINRMDKDELKKRAAPAQERRGLSMGQQQRLKAMKTSGYTIAQIAESLGVSSSTIRNYLKEEG